LVKLVSDEEWRIEREEFFIGGQGITKSKRHWYLTVTHWQLAKDFPLKIWREGYIYKIDCVTNKIVSHKKIPFQKSRYDHVGDIDYFNGLIYLPLEDVIYSRPRILVCNEDLSTYDYADLVDQAHMPWCVINPENGLLLSSEFDFVKYINFYEIKPDHTAKLVDKLRLSKVLRKVQGGCIHEDSLYVSCDDDVKGIYRIDLRSGEVYTLLETRIPYEMEGICADFLENPIFHFIDHEGHLYHAQKVSKSLYAVANATR